MKKKRLFSRAAALAMAAILMVPSSIGTTVFAADTNTETGAESTEPEVSVTPEENNGADTQTAASEETGTDVTPEVKNGTETKTASEETEKPKETKKKQKYTVTLEDAENGMLSFPLSEKDNIKADPENPAKAMKEANEQSLSSSKKYEEGSEVEIDAPAESGYTLEKIELTGKDGQKLQDLTVSEEGTVVFTMPEQDVAVKASFREWTEEEEESFDEELTEEELKESGLPAEEFTEESMQQDAEELSDESAINMASLDDAASSSARLAGAKSIYLSVGGKCRYGRYLTHYFSTNEGQYAYCMNPMKKTPGDGWYTGYLIGNEDARKAFYYCYGGPGYSQFVNATGWIGDGSQQYEYAYSHVILSYMYATYALHDSGRANSAFHGLSTGTRNALINKANQMRYMASPPAGYGCYYFETGRQPIAFQVNNVSTLNLRKSSANPDITNGNPMYSLNGAQYGVYCDAGCTQLATTLTTDGNGNSNTVTLDPGTYYVKEYTAPQGYELDQTVKSIYLGNCDAKTITFSDEPINDPGAIEIQKLDKKTGENVQGIATLAGAQFTVNYYAGDYTLGNLPGSPTRSWVIQTKKKTVNGKDRYVTGLMDEYKVGGQSFYYVGNIPTIPLGTITIQETKAPAGYDKDLELTDAAGFSSKNGVYLANIRKEGDITKLTGGQTLQGTDSYFRGDLVFKKVDGINDNPMADIPFKITNTDTGESHTIYTGSYGIYDSSKIKNSLDTNSDKNGTGIWFGNTDLVDDADGAFEYGSYTIEEISCAANKGKVMYSGSFTINGEKTKIDLGTIVNTSIEVSTTSYGSESETNRIQFDHKSPYYDMGTYKGDYATVLCDDINVKGLTSGYIVSKLVDKETGDFVKDENGSDLQATGKLIEYNDAAAGYTATGSITMPVKDVSNMLGKDYVFFTYIYELKSDGTPNYDNLLVSHTDMNDSQETVSFQNITTELTDSTTGLHDLQSNGKTVTLKDKISLINFPSYDEINFYYIKYEGTLMDASGNPVTDSSGNPVKSTIACHQITKDELENGTSLTYDLSADVMKKYAGQKLTSYVQVYFSYADPSVYENYIEWTAEKDLTNEDQSVSIPVITNTCVSTDNVSYTDTGIMDEVNMVGLIPGNVYTLQGKIVDRTTGKVISSSRTCTYGKDKYEITNVEPGKDGNYTLINADPYKVYHLKRAVSFSDGIAEGYYRLSDDGKDYVLCTESGKELEGNKIGKDAFEVEVLYPGSTFQEVTELSAVTTFTAGKNTAVKNVKFNFDPETLAGKSYVITQDLYFSEKGFIDNAAEDDISGTTVYAVLYDDGNLEFQKRKDTYGSKTVVNVYTFDEGDSFTSESRVPWYSNRMKVKSVTFRDEVKPVSTAYWFYGMENMTQLNLAKLNTSYAISMESMFENCLGIRSVDLSTFNTENVTNMQDLFSNCARLKSIDVSSFNTTNVTNMNSMFCLADGVYADDESDATKINGIERFDTSKVEDMSYMFYGCTNVTQLNVSGFDTSNVTDMISMFSGCYQLSSLDVSGFDTSNVTTMNSMFSGCNQLNSLNVSGFDTSNVTDMSSMFGACIQLSSLDVSRFDTSNVTTMSSMFNGCHQLSLLNVSGFNTSNVTTMNSMFSGCNQLSSLDVSGFDTSNVTDMSYMFRDCSQLNSLDVSGFDTSNVTTMSNMFRGCSQLNSLDVSEFDTNKVIDMSYMFESCTNLNEVVFVGQDKNGINASKLSTVKCMFQNCEKLNSVIIRINKDIGAPVLQYMTNMFVGNNNLKSLELSGLYAPRLEAKYFISIHNNLKKLEILNLNDFYVPQITDMSGMFLEMSSLKKLSLKNFDTTNVVNMYQMFDLCENLKELDVTSFNTSHVKNMDYMFYRCDNLTGTLDLSNFNTCNVTTAYAMFMSDKNLKTIYVSDLWNLENVANMNSLMFLGCTSLIGQSGTKYDGTRAGTTMANYQTGYLTYKESKISTLLAGEAFNDVVPKETDSIIFTDKIAPSGVAVTDLSAEKNNGIVGWLDGTTYYVSTQVSGAKVKANSDCYTLLSNWNYNKEDEKYHNYKSFDVKNLDVSNVTNMAEMFEGTEVTSLDLSSWETKKVIDMSCMFSYCNSLVTVYVSEKWNAKNVTNSNSMFLDCSSIVGQTGVTYNSTKTNASMANYESGYLTCKDFVISTLLAGEDFNDAVPIETESIIFTDKIAPSGVAVTDLSAEKNNGIVGWLDGTTYYVSTQVSGKKIKANSDCHTLLSNWNYNEGDEEYHNYKSFDVKNLDVRNVTNMAEMFEGTEVTSLDLSSWETKKVIDMNSMFSDCGSLTTLDVSRFDTSNVTNMSSMFSGCIQLSSLNVSGFDTSNVTDMSYMFYNCKNLTTIYVGDKWTTSKVRFDSYIFNGCSAIMGQSGVAYDSTKTNVSMANYETGYLTYKAAPQSANNTAKAVVMQSPKIAPVTLSDEKQQEKVSIVEKALEILGVQSSGDENQPVMYADELNSPVLLYQHNDLNDANETFYVPEISSTSLVNSSGEHYFAPSTGSTLIDNVAYKGLKPGTNYTLTGQLMVKDTETAAKDASGNVITATKEFTPTSSNGTVQVIFTFDGSNLGGKTLVAFETLSGIANAGTVTAATKILAVHKDINDASQTVTNMGISTVAKDKASGSKQVTLSSKTTVTDTVSYKGAVAGYKYQLQAVLMDKLTGEAAVDGDGQPITGSKDFAASATSGSATVDLTFNGAGMPGGEYVVYETLYRITDNGSMEKWASHEDMNDEDQLVNVPGITTQLVDAATNTQFVKASSSVNAVDTVYYEGLIPGQSYTLTGQLIEKATGKVFVDGNGKEMTVTKTFTPAEKSGEVDVEFTLNATNLNTSSLVAYETLSLNGKEIVSEKSLDNEYQTLSFPVITSTTAVDKRNGTKVIDAQDNMTIVDTISYTGMQTGLPLTVRSTVMDKATGKAAKDSDGNDIIVESEILPDETNGSIDVEIPIKGRNLMGKTLVVYEEICYADGVVIAQHKDLKDAGQTVTVAGITTTAAIQTTAGQNDRYTSQTVRDTVKYYGLTKGTSYTLQGTLMDKATGNAYQENGKDVTASKTFKASATSGTETLDFEISSSEAKNKTLVVCESVYTAVDGKQVLVAQHSDLTDKDQTVEVPDETVGKLKVTKTIQNGNKNKAFKFTITLKGSRIKDSMMLSGVTFTNGVGTISLKHGESKLIEDIPSGTTYSVVEEQSGLYRPIMATGDAGTIEDGKTAEASFVNMHLKEEEPGEDEVNLTVSKKVLPEDAGAGEKFQFTAVFDHLRANWNYGLSDETEFQSDADGKATVTFTLGKGENVTFLYLPVGCTYRFTEAAGAYTSSYAVTDAAGLQKIATASGANTEEDQEISTATETADKGEKATVTFTNEFQMSQDLTLTKKTVNADGSAYNAKEAFSFTVKFTGLPANAVISSTAGDVTADASGKAAKNVSLKNGEQVIFHELPVGSKYQITESGSEYRPSYSIDAATVVKKTDRIVKRNSSLSTQIETIDKGENDAVTFTNERIVWYALPNTGSYMLVILIGTALIMLMIASRKRKDYLSEK